jgi:hypothetical protein
MRRVLFIVMLVALLGALAVRAFAGNGNGAFVDKAADCEFELPGLEATGLRIQKAATSAGTWQFHCHGLLDSPENAPTTAVVLTGGRCTVPIFLGVGFGRAVITPGGHISVTCHFTP